MIKRLLIGMMGGMLCGAVNAQHQPVFDDYLREAGAHASMFVGKVENGYPPTLYSNHPYWGEDRFLQGEVVYNGLPYQNVALRYDAYLNQLVVNAKEVHVYVQMPPVDEFRIGETRFVRRQGTFMGLLYGSRRMELLQQLQCELKEVIVDNMKTIRTFSRSDKFYLLMDGTKHEVDKLRSVQKLFPAHKKELKRLAKLHRLDFNGQRAEALRTLVEYVDGLKGE